MDDGEYDAGVRARAQAGGSEGGVGSDVGEMNFAPHSRHNLRQIFINFRLR